MFLRAAFSARLCISVRFWPSRMTRPSELGTRRMTALPKVDLPQPDSPTSPTVSPASRSKLTSSTARTMPRALWYWTQRLRTDSSDITRQLLFGSETGGGLVRRQWRKHRTFGAAAIENFGATILECAADRQVGERRHAARDFNQASAAPAHRRWRRAEQAARIGMQGTLEQRSDARLLDLAAGIHHHDAVRGRGNDAQIMGDDNQPHA